jgi:hypothetical protein
LDLYTNIMATPEVKPWVMPEVMKLSLIISLPSPSDRDAIEDTRCKDFLVAATGP